MKRIAYKAGALGMVKVSSVVATYANDDKSKNFKFEVIDGAGPVGASMTAGMRMLFTQDFEEESETEMRRTIERNGVKIIEEYNKSRYRSTIQFMESNRFYIKATGTNMDLDETWKIFKKFDVDDLD